MYDNLEMYKLMGMTVYYPAQVFWQDENSLHNRCVGEKRQSIMYNPALVFSETKIQDH